MSFSQFPIDDRDLDDAELWDVIDSAAAARSRRVPLAIKNSSPASNSSPMPPKLFRSAKDYLAATAAKSRVSPDGEVVQEERWALARPQKMARFVEPVASGDHNRMVVVRHPSRTPVAPSPSYPPPSTGKFSVKEVSPIIESPKTNCWREDEKESFTHSLSGVFPSVSLFKQYQNAAMAVILQQPTASSLPAPLQPRTTSLTPPKLVCNLHPNFRILEKSDYTMIRGNPFIKKSGWRKISFFFNLSFEIRDKVIDYDDNRNVIHAEFLVRAFMQGGRFSDGWGSCELREKHFNKPNHDIPSTAETRAKNKACQDLLGIGEYRPGVSAT